MSETLIDFEERQDELTFPATLPVLPLKDTVVFPESVTPLAIGQERSIKLVEDVVSGERMLALVTVKEADIEQPGWDELYRVGTAAVVHKMIKVPDGTLRILVQGVRRIELDREVSDEPYLVGEFLELADELEETPEVEALTRNVQNLFARVDRARPLPPRGAAARRRERRRSERALQSRRVDAAVEDGGEAAPARAHRRRGAPARGLGDPEPRARGVRARLQDPVPGSGGDGEGPAGVLPAPAAEGDPGRAGRGGRGRGRGQRAALAARRSSTCPRTRARPPTGSSAGSRSFHRPRPSTG